MPSTTPTETGTIVRNRASEVAHAGLTTDRDLAKLMVAMISDIVDGTITPTQSNAVCNVLGKIAKVIELKNKFGGVDPDTNQRTLLLGSNGK